MIDELQSCHAILKRMIDFVDEIPDLDERMALRNELMPAFCELEDRPMKYFAENYPDLYELVD